MRKPAGIYVIATMNFLFGAGILWMGCVMSVYGYANLSAQKGTSLVFYGTLLAFDLILLAVGLLGVNAAYSLLRLKTKGIGKSIVVSIFILLLTLSLLFLDFSVQEAMYAGGKRPPFNIPLHIGFFFYTVWALYYLRKESIQKLFS